MIGKKTVLITGSTSGIGLGIATSFAQAGYNIIFNGLEDNGDQIAADIARRFQIDFAFSSTNLLDPEGLKELVIRSAERFGSIDVLINNGGIQHVAPIEDFPDAMWNKVIGINLTAAFHLIKSVWPYMKKNNFGRIINIASAHGLFASENKSAYVAAKHGLIGLTKTAALEGAPYNITCNALCPGYVKTPLVQKQIADKAAFNNLSEKDISEKYFLVKHAVKEFIPVQAIADMAILLASPGSSTITGAAIPIDGGWSAQ